MKKSRYLTAIISASSDSHLTLNSRTLEVTSSFSPKLFNTVNVYIWFKRIRISLFTKKTLMAMMNTKSDFIWIADEEIGWDSNVVDISTFELLRWCLMTFDITFTLFLRSSKLSITSLLFLYFKSLPFSLFYQDYRLLYDCKKVGVNMWLSNIIF